jgi:tyrosyl-tRNA synthetase
MDIDQLLTRGVTEVLVDAELRAKLKSGRKLRLKQGFDPSKPDMHIGHAVGLRKLRMFQELGHQVVLIVGDWTAQIGDPSGRDETRPRLSAEQVRENAQTYMEQFFLVVDRSRTEVRWQSEWYSSFDLERTLDLTGRFTLAQILAHETFRKRYESGAPMTILELIYPMLQGYDSVAIKADVEFGGTDQKFNNLAGRELMAQMGLVPQDILLVPLIPGTDGRKMGKSFNNTIDVLTPPAAMYGKLMSMSDAVIPLYFEVLTDVPLAEIAEMRRALADTSVNPMELKMRLAREIVAQFCGAAAATDAEAAFEQQFRRRELPAAIPDFAIAQPMTIIDFVTASGMATSRSEVRRLIEGGGISITIAGDKQKVSEPDMLIDPLVSPIIQVGRRRFVRARKK